MFPSPQPLQDFADIGNAAVNGTRRVIAPRSFLLGRLAFARSRFDLAFVVSIRISVDVVSAATAFHRSSAILDAVAARCGAAFDAAKQANLPDGSLHCTALGW